MVSSRSPLLILTRVLALLLSMLLSCGDSSSSVDTTKGDASDTEEDGDKIGDKGDARVLSTEGSTRSDAAAVGDADGSTKNGEARNEDTESEDAGKARALQDGATEGASNEADAEDAGSEDDARQDASRDAGKADAQTDGSKANPERDAAKDAAKDVENPGLLTVENHAECVNNGGQGVFMAGECGDDRRVYAIANPKNGPGSNYCCFDLLALTGERCGGLSEIPCGTGDFCDISLYARGAGCGTYKARGTCRTTLSDQECPDELKDQSGCGCDNQMHSACEALSNQIPTEIGVDCEDDSTPP
jgi:hypothetical protein